LVKRNHLPFLKYIVLIQGTLLMFPPDSVLPVPYLEVHALKASLFQPSLPGNEGFSAGPVAKVSLGKVSGRQLLLCTGGGSGVHIPE
jgi:hypothetical protein